MTVVFQFILLTLAAFRIQRFVTTDEFPPSIWFRKQTEWNAHLEKHFQCSWCFGSIATWIIFAIAAQSLNIPLPALQAVAASSLVGYLGSYDGG